MKTKGVVFDVGGVLVDWKRPLGEFFKRFKLEYKEWRGAFIEDEIRASKGLMDVDEFLTRGMSRLGINEGWDELKEVFIGKVVKIDKSFGLARELKKKGYKLAIVTNTLTDVFDEQEKMFGFTKYFDVVIDSSKVGMAKPEEDIFKLVCKRMKLKPEECLFVDDFEENIETAKRLGFKTVHFTDVDKGIKEVKRVLKIE